MANLRGGALEAIVRRAATYVRRDVREIVFPSSLPDEDANGEKREQQQLPFTVYGVAKVRTHQTMKLL